MGASASIALPYAAFLQDDSKYQTPTDGTEDNRQGDQYISGNPYNDVFAELQPTHVFFHDDRLA